MTFGNPDSKRTVEVLLPGALAHGFDYAVPGGMALSPGDYVTVPFGNKKLPGVVWGQGQFKFGDAAGARGRLKAIEAHHAHLPPMPEAMRTFIDWAAWYNFTASGAVLKMALPVTDALNPPNVRERSNLSKDVFSPTPVALSDEQAVAAKALSETLNAGFSVTLLDGITGSGKTEVYFDAIAKVIANGGQVLVLLPEISLSIQWLDRFRSRFGFAPAVWHSGISPAARKHTWRAIVQGEARVVVGARSGLFLPYRALKLMVADEEHDSSYKQEEGVIYHARDMAVARANFEKIPIVLVSATPSVETWRNVKTGKYREVRLSARHAGASLPDIAMIDMRGAALERGAFIAEPLRAALAQTLKLGHQSMLFLNRRGYAPLVLCRSCGHRFQCPQCSSWLVLHKKGGKRQGAGGQSDTPASCLSPLALLRCHHCSYTIPQPETCPACQAKDSLFACGPGVERIAEEVAAFLPQARVAVMASDSTDTHNDLQERILAMQRGDIDILIGTQMIAKGHHFESLALVGVVDADLGLAGGDLRAAERTFQLLHQLSGRAGRAAVAGKVLIQSFQPDHPVMQTLLSGDREAFMELELREREHARMPPFARLVGIIVEGAKEDSTLALARDLAKTAPKMEGVQVLGPAPAPLYMLRGRYRHRLLLRAPRNVRIQDYLSQWLAGRKLPHSLKIKVDVDPYGFL